MTMFCKGNKQGKGWQSSQSFRKIAKLEEYYETIKDNSGFSVRWAVPFFMHCSEGLYTGKHSQCLSRDHRRTALRLSVRGGLDLAEPH